MRIVAFVGSPIDVDERELIKLAKRLKKEKVNVDLINFGEQEHNTEKLTAFINTLNGKDGTGSHLVTVPPGPHLSGKFNFNNRSKKTFKNNSTPLAKSFHYYSMVHCFQTYLIFYFFL